MSRRARSVPKTGWLLGGLGAVLLLIAAGGYLLGARGTPYRTAPAFPVDEYLASSGTLRGNTYQVEGVMLNAIAWSPETGRLISVQPTGAQAPVPILLPADLPEANVQKGQRWHFLVEVRENGVLYAKALTKS
jgi:hypothetical protein